MHRARYAPALFSKSLISSQTSAPLRIYHSKLVDSIGCRMRVIVATMSSASERPTRKFEQNYPQPTPQDGDILVKLACSPIQPSDFLNTRGGFPSTTFPRISGRDFAGTVVSESPLQGKRVHGTSGRSLSFTVDGAHAEYVVVLADAVVEIPSALTMKQASVLGTPWSTAWLALTSARAKKGRDGTDYGCEWCSWRCLDLLR